MKAIINAEVIAENDVLSGYAVIFDEKVLALRKNEELNKADYEEVVDLNGRYLSAGFIDIHIHGCLGRDTMDEEEDSLSVMSHGIAGTGVTGFLPATMTVEFSKIEKAFERIRKAMGGCAGAEILGCHMEGPFISPDYKGAQDAANIMEPDFGLIDGYKDVVKLITMAPELSGSQSFIEECVKNNIIVSIGHTGAAYEQAIDAIAKGVKSCTHTFNAMTPLHHRKPGVVGAAMDSDVNCELIADNIHVNPAAQRILLKVKGIDRIILVTDAMRACLLSDGEYDLGGQRVYVRGGEARLTGGTLAGSLLTLDRAVRNFKRNTGISIVDAVKTVTSNPARLLGLEESKGSIEAGKDADFTSFDKDINIFSTYVKGKKVYERLSHESSSMQRL